MNFIRRLNRGNFYFSNQSFQIWWLIGGIEVRKTYKFQLNISKIMAARPKKHRAMGCEYHYSNPKQITDQYENYSLILSQ